MSAAPAGAEKAVACFYDVDPTMKCPKCGEDNDDGAFICVGCDFILDPSFLGEDILNERTGEQRPVSAGGDALILGDIDADAELMFSDATGSFLAADTVDVERVVQPAPVYVSRAVADMLRPEAVLAPSDTLQSKMSSLSPFEQHVLQFIDGRRPVARVRKKTGLSPDDVRIALGLLIEKNAVSYVGTVQRPQLKDLVGDLLGDSGEFAAVAAADVEAVNDPLVGDTEEVDLAPPPRATPKPVSGSHDRLTDVAAAMPPPAPRTAPSQAPPSVVAPSPWDVPDEPGPTPSESKMKARQFYEAALEELRKGNKQKGQFYVKLAADTDPHEPRYAEMLRTWSVSSKSALSEDQQLVLTAEQAERSGNTALAIATLRKLMERVPNDAALLNRLALLLAMREKKYSEASELLMRAVSIDHQNVAYKNNLGKIIALAEGKSAGISRGSKDQGGLLSKLKKALE